MRLIERVGSLVTGGFDGLAPSQELKELLLSYRMGGVILYSRNIESLDQVRELIAGIRGSRKGERVLISVDQEGGRVSRLPPPATPLPSQAVLGEAGDPGTARIYGRLLGRECSSFGFDIDFAPVLDLRLSENAVVGDRSLGPEPEKVASLGVEIMEGILEEGIIPCAKHFPGHGRSEVDSHLKLPIIDISRDEMDGADLLPFRRAVERGVPMIMTAHIVYTGLDRELPATLSRRVMDILRRDLGFEGVIVTDDLLMRAIREDFPFEETIPLCLRSGVDMLLFSKDPEAACMAIESMVRIAERSSRVRERIEGSFRRLRVLAMKLEEMERKGGGSLPLESREHLKERDLVMARLMSGHGE